MIYKNEHKNEFRVFFRKNLVIYVEQLERTEDDGDVEVMSAQSVCDLI